jgi:hypothetical protein
MLLAWNIESCKWLRGAAFMELYFAVVESCASPPPFLLYCTDTAGTGGWKKGDGYDVEIRDDSKRVGIHKQKIFC